MTKLHLNRMAWVAALMFAIVALPAGLAAQPPILEVADGIVKVDGPTTGGAVDLHIKSLSAGDAILGMGVSPDFFGGNTDALIFGYNGNAAVGSGFIGTRPSSGNGNINIFIKNFKVAEFTSTGINLPAGKDYRVNGVALNVPDYVFADDYALMPINELASFVETERHLPGIPSEGEIKDGSLGLAGFQMKLLEKVEELTLYTIDQEKRIAALQEQLEALQR